MSISKITILKGTTNRHPQLSAQTKVSTFQELKTWIFRGTFLVYLFRYSESQLLVSNIETLPKPFLTALLIRLLSRNQCYITDERGRSQIVNVKLLLKLLRQLLIDAFSGRILLRQIRQEIETLYKELDSRRIIPSPNWAYPPLYLRTDLSFGLCSGGSVGHIAGVLNNLDAFAKKPVLFTTDFIPTVRPDIEVRKILPVSRYWDFIEIPSLYFNQTFYSAVKEYTGNEKIAFIYQRYSRNNFAGLKLAKSYNVPFILEYNGSEIWMNQHWGKGLKYLELSEEIELLNLKGADVIVVVSRPMKDELVERGIEAGKILVNPNGVNPERYAPDVDSGEIRNKYGLQNKTVIGFIGTFGPWHGAEVLVDAFGLLLQKFPEYRKQLRLLMIGDGITMPQVKQNIAKFKITDTVILTGLVPQEQGPVHLAACDILASPHVPNPDGTPFFGSPTKLFEYMAMGKGIVASDLDQIGEVLAHNRTAWMVKPGDALSLMEGMKTLIDDKPLREKLGKAARQEAVAKYTWQEHTSRIIEKLKEMQ